MYLRNAPAGQSFHANGAPRVAATIAAVRFSLLVYRRKPIQANSRGHAPFTLNADEILYARCRRPTSRRRSGSWARCRPSVASRPPCCAAPPASPSCPWLRQGSFQLLSNARLSLVMFKRCCSWTPSSRHEIGWRSGESGTFQPFSHAQSICLVQVGLGWSCGVGTGLVVARREEDDSWSPPSALAAFSAGWGLQV